MHRGAVGAGHSVYDEMRLDQGLELGLAPTGDCDGQQTTSPLLRAVFAASSSDGGPARCARGRACFTKGAALLLPRAALVAVPMLIEIPGLVARMIVMLTGHFFLTDLVPMPVLVEVARLMARVIMVLAGHLFLTRLVAVAVLVDVPRLVAGMIVMLAGLVLRHGNSPLLG